MTGETIESDYFQRLHQLRNDSAQESRRHGAKPKKEVKVPVPVPGGSEGCESVHNDQRKASEGVGGGCEAI